MAKDLDRIILIGEEEYNVNAVQADKVQGTLKINKINLDGSVSKDQNVEYNGEYEKTIDLVTAAGGRFNGPIRVPDNTNSNINNEAVLNYHDIKKQVVDQLTKSSTLYSWSSSDNKLISNTTNNNINGISIVEGPETGISGFATTNYNNCISYPKNTDTTNKWLSAYLYIAKDTNDNYTGNIYFGTAKSNTAVKLAQTASHLATSHTFITDLESEASGSFNGTNNVIVGVTGELPLANGGLGGDISSSTSLAAKNAEYYINGSITQPTSTTTVTDSTEMLFRRTNPSQEAGQYYRKEVTHLWTYLVGKIRSTFGFNTNNVLPAANGGTGQTNLNSVTVGQANAVKVSYKASSTATATNKYPNVTIAPSESYPSGPSGGSDGDIMILF